MSPASTALSPVRHSIPELNALVGFSWDQIDAVVFDIGGVFLIRHQDPIRNGMSRAGFTMPADDGANYHDAHYKSVRALSDVTVSSGETINEYSPEFWRNYERAYLLSLGVAEEDLAAALDAMRAEVHMKEAKPIWRKLLTHNIDAFNALGASGMPLAIVTNNDGTAERQMIDFGICQVGNGPLTKVSAIADSGDLNVAKPEPEIFLPALAALGTDPARTLYVGDTIHADVVGATRAGMPVVQLDPLALHTEFPHTRAPDVAEITRQLLNRK